MMKRNDIQLTLDTSAITAAAVTWDVGTAKEQEESNDYIRPPTSRRPNDLGSNNHMNRQH